MRGKNKKQKTDPDGREKNSSECKNEGKKIQYNPAIHSVKMEKDYRSQKRFRKREKQKKEKRKAVEKESDYLQDYHNILLDNLLKEFYTTKSPHLIISRQYFFQIKRNSIMLKNAHESLDGNHRKVYYEVDKLDPMSDMYRKIMFVF